MSGIEPPSRAWQARVIAIIPHPQRTIKYVPRVRIEPTTSSFSEKRSTTELPRHIFFYVDDTGLEPVTPSV